MPCPHSCAARASSWCATAAGRIFAASCPVCRGVLGLDIVDRLGVQFAHHRSGWTCAVDALSPLHRKNGLGIDTFVELTFAGLTQPSAAHERPWVGICHVPTVIPEWFPDTLRAQFFPYYSQGKAWQAALEHCVGLFALSEAHAEELRRATGLTVCRLMHPTEIPSRQWTTDGFLASPTKKVVQIGWWLRNMHAIYQAQFPGFEKVLLELTGQGHVQEYFSREGEYLLGRGDFKTEMLETVTRVPYVSNQEYDRLLSESIVFLDLYASSANNAIIECIARGTPLLVNRLPAVEEYLGADYPLYFSCHDEAAEKAANIDLLEKAHLWLQAPGIRSRICAQNFLTSFVGSSIYQEAARAAHRYIRAGAPPRPGAPTPRPRRPQPRRPHPGRPHPRTRPSPANCTFRRHADCCPAGRVSSRRAGPPPGEYSRNTTKCTHGGHAVSAR